MERFKNKTLWVAIFAFVGLMTKELGYAQYIPENYELLVDTFLGILVMAGILVNPTTPGIKD